MALNKLSGLGNLGKLGNDYSSKLASKMNLTDKATSLEGKKLEMDDGPINTEPGSYPYKTLIEDTPNKKQMTEYRELLDNIIRSTGSGSTTTRFQDTFYGLNRLNQIPELPLHKESQGLIFFTRPDLNLSYENLSPVRQLSYLLTQDTKTMSNAIKLMLDPSTQRGGEVMTLNGPNLKNVIDSPLVDPYNPYLSLLTNTCITMSPPPDIGLNFYTSPEGKYREQWMMNDGFAESNSYQEITATFSNIQGNAVLFLFLSWILYMGYLRVGDMGPHPWNRFKNRMDYFTRIERYKMDESGRFITQWFHTGASAPKSINIGASFGLNRTESPMEMDNKEVSIQFGSVGFVYNDPIQLFEFNMRMIRWNPNLADHKRKELFMKMHPDDRGLTNYYGYPLINLSTREMEWWILKEDYARLVRGLEFPEYDKMPRPSPKYNVGGFERENIDGALFDNEHYIP